MYIYILISKILNKYFLKVGVIYILGGKGRKIFMRLRLVCMVFMISFILVIVVWWGFILEKKNEEEEEGEEGRGGS